MATDKLQTPVEPIVAYASLASVALDEIGALNDGRIVAVDELLQARDELHEVHATVMDFHMKKQLGAALGHIDGAISRLVEVGG